MTKTFLIIDGQGFCFNPREMEEAFTASGIQAEFQITDHRYHILDIIREWKERGLKLDVITCDVNATRDNSGVGFLVSVLDEVAEKIGSDMLPQKLFFHSADWKPEPIVTKYGTSPCIIHDGEVGRLENEQGVYGDMEHYVRGRELRDYLNANWGTRFVMSKAEENNLNNPNGPLDPDDITDLLYNHGIEPEQALQRIKLHNADRFIDRPYIDKPDGSFDKEPCQLSFARGVAGTVAGSVAYNTEDIAHVKAECPQEPVMLILDSAANYESPPQGIDALVVLEDDVHAAHIKQVCENMGVPALIGVSRDDDWSDCKFSAEEGLSFSQYRGSKQSGVLKVGSGLTMQAYSSGGTLYAGKFPLEYGENYGIGNYRAVIAAADSELQKHSFNVKANTDTAAQVKDAIETGADGIGLVRTEHMFFEPEKKNVLREILLTSITPPHDNLRLYSSFHEIQQADFRAILETANTAEREFPVTIRLLDAPPHEFMNAVEVELFEARVGKGNTRGVQAGLRTYGLYEAQISALCEAFHSVRFQHPLHVLVPNVLSEDEMEQVRVMFNRHAQGTGITLSPMVETRGYLNELTSLPQIPYSYVSYGTNDLTSEFMNGAARNDVPRIIAWMKEHYIHGKNPFLSLMEPVKAEIMKLQSRQDAPPATICGQQIASDERSIRWAVENGLNLSVPFRYIPYVKMVAGQQLLSSVPL